MTDKAEGASRPSCTSQLYKRGARKPKAKAKGRVFHERTNYTKSSTEKR